MRFCKHWLGRGRVCFQELIQVHAGKLKKNRDLSDIGNSNRLLLEQ